MKHDRLVKRASPNLLLLKIVLGGTTLFDNSSEWLSFKNLLDRTPCMYGHHICQSVDQPGKVTNSARGQLNRENEYFSVPVRA